jgi:alkylation response protein AidB-like acyl-CoA dehydrogenase
MYFATTEEHRQLADSLQRLLAEANDFESRRNRLRSASPDLIALWPKLADLGVIAAAFDAEHSGFAGDPRTMAVVLEAIGEALVVEPYLANAVIAGRILQQSTTLWARTLIEQVIQGQHICVLAHDAGTDPFSDPGVAAKPDNEEFVVLTGSIRCVRHADVADSFLVACTEGGTTSLYRLPRATPGLTLKSYRLIDDAGGGDLELQSVRVSSSERLAFEGPASSALHDALEWGMLGLAAESAGIVGALNRATFSYLGSRKQFGVTLANFQALQHRAADMFIASEEICAAVSYGIEALSNPPAAVRSAAICAAKVIADAAARRVGHEAVQMHGGMGVSDELNVSHYMRRLAAIRAELGSADTHRLRFASLQ